MAQPEEIISAMNTVISLALFILFSSCGRIEIPRPEPELHYYFVELQTNPDRAILPNDEALAIQEAHLVNIERLHQEGKLVAAGPFDGGGGVFILKAPSIRHARRWVDSDPAVQANRFLAPIFRMQIEFGGIYTVGENHEMITTTYCQFIHDSDLPLTEHQLLVHHEFIADLAEFGHVLLGGKLGKTGNYLLIMSLENEKELEKLVTLHPLVIDGTLDYDLRLLWIAQETFIETSPSQTDD